MPNHSVVSTETLSEHQVFVMSDELGCSNTDAKVQDRSDISRFVMKNTIKAIEPTHKSVTNVTVNNMPVLKSEIHHSTNPKQKKNQPVLLNVYGFATNDKRINYLLKLRQASDGSIVEPVLVAERLSLPVDQCLTVHDQVKKLKLSVLGLLEKYERVVYTDKERMGKHFNYTTFVADQNSRLRELCWLDFAHEKVLATHTVESVFLEYDRCQEEFTRLNTKYTGLLAEYNKIDAEIKIFEKMNDASLLSCSLAKYVNVKNLDDFFTTDYLTCCLIVVPKTGVNEFLAEYAILGYEDADNSKRKGRSDQPASIPVSTSPSDESAVFLGVVPGSARKLKDDSTHSLFSIILFKKDHQRCMDYFREKKWIVREYIPEEADAGSEGRLLTLTHVKADREKIFQQHVENTLSACLGLVIDISILELYTEAQLRFGTDFQMLMFLGSGVTKKALKQIVNYSFNELLNGCDQRVYDVDVEAENPYLPFVLCSTKLADEAAIKAK